MSTARKRAPAKKPAASKSGKTKAKAKPTKKVAPAKKAARTKPVKVTKPARKVAAKKPAPSVAQMLAARAAPEPDQGLTPSHEAFWTEYLRNGQNGTAAWMATHPGVGSASASVSAHRLLRQPKFQVLIEAERQRMASKLKMTREDLLAELVAIVRADTNELMQMRQISCGSCWPEEKDGRSPHWQEPNPECEHCRGEGLSRPWFTPGCPARAGIVRSRAEAGQR